MITNEPSSIERADPPRCRMRVRLRVWGFTCTEVAHAEQVARELPRAAFWEIAEVIPTVGGTCPIPSGDTIALDQGSDYDWAWAAYSAGPHAG